MLFSTWLRSWKCSLEIQSSRKQTRRRKLPVHHVAIQPRLEALENRTLLSPVLTAMNLTVSGSNGAVVSNTGTVSDTTPGASVTLTASTDTVVQYSPGTWSWSQTTPSGAAQTAPVTIYATDSNGQTAQSDFWVNVGQVFTVMTGVDNGNDASPTPGSLRAAMIAANQAPASGIPSLIAFNIPTTDPSYDSNTGSFDVLTPTQTGTIPNLPDLTAPVIIDGYTQPGAQTNTLARGDKAVLKIVLNGSQAGTSAIGLDVNAPQSVVRGLDVTDWGNYGILLDTNSSNSTIAGNFVGTDVTGEIARPNGSGPVLLFGVLDNAGMRVNSANNLIGGTDPASRNLVSGNDGDGVFMFDYDTWNTQAPATVFGNQIEGNFIGTDATGTKALANVKTSEDGFGISATAGNNNTIGGSVAGAGNLISGNQDEGILVAGESGDVIQGNKIGTDATGEIAVPNGTSALTFAPARVRVGGDQSLLVGGTAPGAGNLISGNDGYGVYLENNLTGLEVQGNLIGTDIKGTMALGNQQGGVYAGTNVVGTMGGTTAAARNIISGNGNQDVAGIVYDNAPGLLTEGNYIGTDVTGTKAVPNFSGIVFNSSNGSGGATIGGTVAGAGNLISGNTYDGIDDWSPGNNTIEGNLIGTNAAGTAALGNGGFGIEIHAGSNNNTIGGTTGWAGNVISANDAGVVVYSSGNMIEGNCIGTDASGKTSTGTDGQPLGNHSTGVYFSGTNNTLGGTTAAARNIISGTRNGFGNGAVSLLSGATGNMVEGNYIGTDVTGKVALGNGDNVWGSGVWIGQASNNTISGNVISASLAGVIIDSNGEANSLTSGNVFQGNLIGTDASGTQTLDNTSYGVVIDSGQGTQLTGNVIAVTNPVDGNSQGTGVVLQNGSDGTMVQGNHIGTDASNTLVLGSQYDGIDINVSSGNTISGNTIAHSSADEITIGKFIGAASNNAINDNTITSNAGNGVAVYAGTGTSILGNSIHDHDGMGIFLNSANNANDKQAAPVLTTGTSSANSTTVSGTLASVPSTTFRIEFFSNHGLDAHNNAEGQTYLGFTTVTTDSNGNASFTATNLAAIPAGQGYLTATATNQSTGDTSQFSNYLTAPTSTVLTSSATTPLLNQQVTFTATVNSSFGAPTGSVDFVDTTTGTDLGSVALVNGTATLSTSALAVGNHTIVATYGSNGFFLSSQGSTSLTVLPPASLSGIVFEDFNDNGQVDFGEQGIAGVTITLTGTDDLGHAVSQTQATDSNGAYVFLNLRPGNYYLTETQLSGYLQGIDTLGTAGGSLSATDQFFVTLGQGVNGFNYNYGVAANYGFIVSGNGLGTATVNVGSNGAAFGVANNSVLTVLDLLKATDAQAVAGLLYNGDATLRKEANNVYSAINEQGNIG